MGAAGIVAAVARNPNWTVDELILTLDVYMRCGRKVISRNHPEIVHLENDLAGLPIYRDIEFRGRTSDAIVMKMANFAAIDAENPIEGMKSGGKLDREVFQAYEQSEGLLFSRANAIRSALGEGLLEDTMSSSDDFAIEGRTLTALHRKRERDPRIGQKRKQEMRKDDGELSCEVCGVSEDQLRGRYALDSGDLFECHHRQPLHTLSMPVKTRTADLAVICPTCHRAIHRYPEIPRVDEMAVIVADS